MRFSLALECCADITFLDKQHYNIILHLLANMLNKTHISKFGFALDLLCPLQSFETFILKINLGLKLHSLAFTIFQAVPGHHALQ